MIKPGLAKSEVRPVTEAAGGRWVTHTSAQNSIDQLQAMGIGS